MVHRVDFPQEIHPERLLAIEKLGDCKDKKVLDIGCGAHKSFPKAIGIDILPVTDLKHSGDDLPFEDNQIDAIISRHSFEHFLDPVKVLKEWIRVLKKGGKIVIVLPDHARMDTMGSAMNDGSHLHAYTQESFRNLTKLFPKLRIKEAGLAIDGWSFFVVIEIT